ncbi:hypothetical protein K1I48_20245 [Bacillus licheniformis]|uniref:hypothetical protein n=1 Tax=Bacillus licheniformis TaxID=1402 RepID=UPI0005CED011|nr:hypothetical protein [Bacillus licheniformis]KJE29883.1 putative membrane protein [Bacillus licheniformis]MBW7635761.1 hypothetical protein [Bacillus licheniformis]OAZ60204.1 hypothetical protein SRCM100115_04264 [Bacillus licheniformis]TWM95662.1 hypothetical protein CHCC14596_1635 [Bacillus licheniformis]
MVKKIVNRLNSFSLLGTIFFIGSYLMYKFNGVELIGFLYSGIIFLTVLIATTVMLIRQKRKGTNENKQA